MSDVSGFVLVERDKKIIREIDRWRVIQGRHIRELCGFSGQRACDRRLRKLIEVGYIKREKILYGVAGIYKNTARANKIMEKRVDANRGVRADQMMHDIAVVDTAIFLEKTQGVAFEDMTTEIELHRLDGFGVRKHRPDLVYTINDKTTCVEVELTLKAKNRFENIIKENFSIYDNQIWVVPDLKTKIATILETNKIKYSNIHILELEEVQESCKSSEMELYS